MAVIADIKRKILENNSANQKDQVILILTKDEDDL